MLFDTTLNAIRRSFTHYGGSTTYPLFSHVGSIEVQVVTMSKLDRLKTEEVYVCGFVPSYVLPKKMPWSLDPFLHPLITEIEDAFINGMC